MLVSLMTCLNSSIDIAIVIIIMIIASTFSENCELLPFAGSDESVRCLRYILF